MMIYMPLPAPKSPDNRQHSYKKRGEPWSRTTFSLLLTDGESQKFLVLIEKAAALACLPPFLRIAFFSPPLFYNSTSIKRELVASDC